MCLIDVVMKNLFSVKPVRVSISVEASWFIYWADSNFGWEFKDYSGPSMLCRAGSGCLKCKLLLWTVRDVV